MRRQHAGFTTGRLIAVAVAGCLTQVGCGDDRPECMEKLHRIGLALHAFHDDRGSFPKAAISDKNGRPGLSWRVAILPYLGEKELYDKFHLDEPWDSPHNKTLLAEMPEVYACPSLSRKDRSFTNYRAYTGHGAFFEPPFDAKFAPVWWTDPDGTKHYQTEPTSGLSIASFMDGTANTLMVVEAKQAVPWTQPEGLPFEDKPVADPLRGAGSPHRGGFDAVLVDGSVRFLKTTIDPKVLRLLILRNDGEMFDRDAL